MERGREKRRKRRQIIKKRKEKERPHDLTESIIGLPTTKNVFPQEKDEYRQPDTGNSGRLVRGV